MKVLNFPNYIFNKSYLTISVLGKSLKLNIKYLSTSHSVELVKKETEIDLFLPIKYKNKSNIDVINSAIGKLYFQLANVELEYSLELARHIFKFAPEDYKIERLNGIFYKNIKNKILIINPDIMQYSRNIINTTLLQAFCKMKYKENSKAYKKALELAMEIYEKHRIEMLIEEKIYKIG